MFKNLFWRSVCRVDGPSLRPISRPGYTSCQFHFLTVAVCTSYVHGCPPSVIVPSRVAVARTWNSLSQHVTSTPSMSVLRGRLKATFLSMTFTATFVVTARRLLSFSDTLILVLLTYLLIFNQPVWCCAGSMTRRQPSVPLAVLTVTTSCTPELPQVIVPTITSSRRAVRSPCRKFCSSRRELITAASSVSVLQCREARRKV